MIRWIFRQIFRCLALLFLILLATAIFIVVDGLNDNATQADVGVVLGCSLLSNGQPSPALRQRLEKAVEAYRQQKIPLIVVSGSSDLDGHYNEAQSMSRYLQAHGVPATAILEDAQGTDTQETSRHVARLVVERKLHSVLVISHYYHLTRTKLLMRQNGVNNLQQLHAGTVELANAKLLLREILALYYYLGKYYWPYAEKQAMQTYQKVDQSLKKSSP